MADNSPQEDHDRILIGAVGGTLRRLVKFASSAFSLFFVAGLIGWVRARYYFGAFGFPWIANELSTVSLLSMSISSLSILLLSFIAVFSFLSDQKLNPSKIHTAYMVLAWVVAFIYFIGWLIKKIWSPVVPFPSDIIASGLTPVMAAVLFAFLVVALRLLNFKWNFGTVLAAGLSLYGIIWSTPRQIGEIQGKKDVEVWKATLPTVEIKGSSEQWYLLYSSGDLLYAVNRKNGESLVHLKVLPISDVNQMNASL